MSNCSADVFRRSHTGLKQAASRIAGTAVCCLHTVLSVAAFAGGQADFLIIEKPSALSIFSRFEQALSPVQLAALPAYAAFQIIKEKAVLGDQITEASLVRMGAADYYFLRDENGDLAGAKAAGNISRLNSCAILGDTVTVARSGAIYLAHGQGRTSPGAGDLIVRIFNSSGRIYCSTSGSKVAYGWCSGDMAALSHKPVSMKKNGDMISQDISRRIVRRMESANQTYQRYFEYFNDKTGAAKSIPRWEIAVSDKQIQCHLKASPECRLEESTRLLVRDLENIVSGGMVSVAHSQSTITIAIQ